MKLSWSAVFGGAFVALGVWILLYAFGLAIGLSAINPAAPSSARSAGLGTGLWSLVAPLIALFVGGMVAARTAGLVDRVAGALHGAVLWGLTAVLGLLLIGVAVRTLVGGVLDLGSKAVAGAALDTDALLTPLNARLREQGKPVVSAEQLQAIGRELSQTALAGGVGREQMSASIARHTALSREDASELGSGIQQQMDRARSQAGTTALQVADQTGKAMWGVFGALLLGALSAVLGATLGVSRRQQAASHPPLEVTGRPGEVFP